LKCLDNRSRFRTRLSFSLAGFSDRGAYKRCQISLIQASPPFPPFHSPLEFLRHLIKVMTTGVWAYASLTYTSSELYTRKGKCKRHSGLGLGPSPGPRRKRTSHTAWLFFFKSVTIRSTMLSRSLQPTIHTRVPFKTSARAINNTQFPSSFSLLLP
jgi:hypothetical protein